MEPEKFIIKELEKLTAAHPTITVRYGYDKQISVHFVEVMPESYFRENKEYVAWEGAMFDKFVALFPSENICFVSAGDLVKVTKPIYEKIGSNPTQNATTDYFNTAKQRSNYVFPDFQTTSGQYAYV